MVLFFFFFVVLWGRCVYDNIRKFLQFQLTVNVVALCLVFIAACLDGATPLNAIMMLWVNLIMDTMGALALGTEMPKEELLSRKPYKRSAPLISRPMARNILVQSAFQLLVLLLFLYYGPSWLGTNKGDQCIQVSDGLCVQADYSHYSVIFNIFVFCQVFNEFNARSIGDDWQAGKIFSLLTTVAVPSVSIGTLNLTHIHLFFFDGLSFFLFFFFLNFKHNKNKKKQKKLFAVCLQIQCF